MPARNQEIYERTASDIKAAQEEYLNLLDLLDTLKDTGMDTTEPQAKAIALKKKIDAWAAVLIRKGYME